MGESAWPANGSFLPGTHVKVEKKEPTAQVSFALHTCTVAHMPTHTHIKYTQNGLFTYFKKDNGEMLAGLDTDVRTGDSVDSILNNCSCKTMCANVPYAWWALEMKKASERKC